MTRFSANLGFLWTDRALPDAIRAAKAAGFDAVECHWPYDVSADAVRAALDDTGLPMLGLNTRRGDVAAGENGLCALPGREAEARAAIDEALDYARVVKVGAVHVMAGFASGSAARETFVENLRYACGAAGDRTILIEPLNRHDAPGYYLQTTDQAAQIIAEVNAPNLKLMFDCYHVGRNEGDVITRLGALKTQIGHIQFASVPERAAPDQGELNYAAIFAAIDQMGWDAPLGAEYKPGGDTDATLGWMQTLV
ncbi:TIM barrel protein [uncultured Tateyamaria sp.]|uniref:hydroxypyruvate isomerase family protein n=1 Tax=uncultured Tateyamaria sp. TaxID=455651 RepID=UPI00260E9AC0|nr:TIM barrel protein [uncultured Tateyamaria sp.]